MQAYDDANNIGYCDFTVTVNCGQIANPDTCIIEAPFSNLLWSSYLGGDGEEEIVDIHM
ncbi:MAG: hypothetical protein R2766_01085 [Saprospiraceae bacterium]